jgi:hypothetical protein
MTLCHGRRLQTAACPSSPWKLALSEPCSRSPIGGFLRLFQSSIRFTRRHLAATSTADPRARIRVLGSACWRRSEKRFVMCLTARSFILMARPLSRLPPEQLFFLCFCFTCQECVCGGKSRTFSSDLQLHPTVFQFSPAHSLNPPPPIQFPAPWHHGCWPLASPGRYL